MSDNTETAVLGGGCFWLAPTARFRILVRMQKTEPTAIDAAAG